MENKFKAGDVVCERVHPTHILIISKVLNGIYYAKSIGHKKRKDLVFLETDIKAISVAAQTLIDIKREWQFSFSFPTLFRLWRAVAF